MNTRRQFLKSATMLGAGTLLPARVFASAGPSLGVAGLPVGTLEASVLTALPGKRPLIKRACRPPNYETPIEDFDTIFTPNDAFFVRYHLEWIPDVASAEWRLEVAGDAVERPLTLTLASLQHDFE